MSDERADKLARLDELVSLRKRRLSSLKTSDTIDVNLSYSTEHGANWRQRVPLAFCLDHDDQARALMYIMRQMSEKLRPAIDYTVSIDLELATPNGRGFDVKEMASSVFGPHLSDVAVSYVIFPPNEHVTFTIHEKGVYRLDSKPPYDLRYSPDTYGSNIDGFQYNWR